MYGDICIIVVFFKVGIRNSYCVVAENVERGILELIYIMIVNNRYYSRGCDKKVGCDRNYIIIIQDTVAITEEMLSEFRGRSDIIM